MLIAVALVSGILAATAGQSPTGSTVVDAVIIVTAVASVVVLASTAPRNAVVAATIIAGALSASIPCAALSIVAVAAALVVTQRRPEADSLVNAAMAGVAMNVAARSDLGLFLGDSAIVAVGVGAVIAIGGLSRATSRIRWPMVVCAIAWVVIAGAGTIAFLIAAAMAVGPLRAGNAATDEGLAQLRRGDVDDASASFAAAADHFHRADTRLGSPLTALANIVPVVAQHRRAGVELSSAAAIAAAALSDHLQAIDLDAVASEPGLIDLDAVRALGAPLRDIRSEIDRLTVAVEASRSPWLADPVERRLDRLFDDLVAEQARSDDVVALVEAAPALLGGNEPRNYFVAFTTPSEVRGLGGFMGIWSTMTVDDGRIEFSDLDRVDGLAFDARGSHLVLDGPDEWLRRYGQFGFETGPGGTVRPGAWGNVTISPQADSTGEVVAQMFPAGGGAEIDGFIAIDILAVSQLLEFAGPVTTSDGTTLTTESAPDFLLYEQYQVTDRPERTNLLEEVARHVLDRLLKEPLPPAVDLLDALGPMIEQGRLVGWSAHPAEQALFELSGFAGGLPDPGFGDGVAVTFNNAAGSKIDYFLRARARYDVVVDADTGSATATMLLEMENRAPPQGEPDYVIGNLVDLPTGTNRTWTSVYTRLPVEEVRLDGEVIPTESGIEAGYFTTSMFVTMAPGQIVALEFDMEGPVDLRNGYHLVVHSPPTASTTPVSAEVTVGTRDDAVATGSVVTEIGSERLVVPLP